MSGFYRFDKNIDKIAKTTTDDSARAKYDCPICEDNGVLIAADGSVHPCECWLRKRREAAWEHAGLPKALRRMNFDNFDFSYYPDNRIADTNRKLSYYDCAKKAFDATVKFVDAAKNNLPLTGLMLQGPVGSGKTHLAAAICNELLAAGQAVQFVVVPEFLDDLRASYRDGGDEVGLMNKVQAAPVLILDDLGAHNFSDWTKNKLFSILNYRLNHELPCVITTNLAIKSLQDILGERIVSRLVAACDIYLLPVDRDIRLVQAKNK